VGFKFGVRVFCSYGVLGLLIAIGIDVAAHGGELCHGVTDWEKIILGNWENGVDIVGEF